MFLETLHVEWRNSTPRFAWTPERRNLNTNLNKYFISSSGDRPHNQSRLQPHSSAPAPRLTSYYLKINIIVYSSSIFIQKHFNVRQAVCVWNVVPLRRPVRWNHKGLQKPNSAVISSVMCVSAYGYFYMWFTSAQYKPSTKKNGFSIFIFTLKQWRRSVNCAVRTAGAGPRGPQIFLYPRWWGPPRSIQSRRPGTTRCSSLPTCSN